MLPSFPLVVISPKPVTHRGQPSSQPTGAGAAIVRPFPAAACSPSLPAAWTAPNPKKTAVAEAGFPDDALVEILSRLPAKPLNRSKCVSKAWRDLIADPLHRKKLPQTLQGFFFMAGGGGSGSRKRAHFGFINLLPRSTPLDIDPRFSFLTKLPDIKVLTLLDSCNGLLFKHGRRKLGPSDELGYVVCNPSTKQWEAVPRYGSPPPRYARGETRYTYLVFDPAVSPYFHMVQFWFEYMHMVGYNEGSSEEVCRVSWADKKDIYWKMRKELSLVEEGSSEEEACWVSWAEKKDMYWKMWSESSSSEEGLSGEEERMKDVY